MPRKQRLWFRFDSVHAEPGALLRKVIVSAGYAESERDIKRIMRQGGVKVNGVTVKETEFALGTCERYEIRIGAKRVLEIEMVKP